MFLDRADYIEISSSLHHLAVRTHFFDRSSHFHSYEVKRKPLKLNPDTFSLLEAMYDATTVQIIRTHLKRHAIPGK